MPRIKPAKPGTTELHLYNTGFQRKKFVITTTDPSLLDDVEASFKVPYKLTASSTIDVLSQVAQTPMWKLITSYIGLIVRYTGIILFSIVLAALRILKYIYWDEPRTYAKAHSQPYA